jgi:AraC family ethanolamine operon transcriptional activator
MAPMWTRWRHGRTTHSSGPAGVVDDETDEFSDELTLRRQRRLVELAAIYVESRQEYRTTVTEICQALGVGRRTLEYAFREVLGTSPKAYFMQRALERAHHKLQLSTPAESTVTQVATEFGFWHLGRFAVTYRTAFGETPSETLRAMI